MMGPSQKVPLPHVATDDLEYDGKTHKVLESEVFLEIANETDSMTVRRQIKGSQHKHVINVWKGAVLSQPNLSYGATNYIVRESGGASREMGFHRFLAEFIGWQLPQVPTYDENEVLLYMETIFPLMFVEQKHGWSNLRNRFPTYLKIKDISRRVFEFLTALDAQKIATQKIILKQQATSIENSWRAKVEECSLTVQAINATIGNMPLKPTAIWPPSIQPVVLIAENDDWLALSQVLSSLEERLEILALQEIPSVSQVSEVAQQELQEKQENLSSAEANLRIKFDEIENQEAQIALLDSRIQSIQEELVKHKDLRRLSTLGAAQDLHSTSGTCPTCTQSISSSLITPQEISEPMTITQNVEFIREQLNIFEAMQQSERKNLDLRKRQLDGVKSRISDLRSEIRSLKTTLTSPNNTPSYSYFEERVRLAEKVRLMRITRDQIDVLLGGFSVLAEQWQENQANLSSLPKGIFSSSDEAKLKTLERSFRQQLQEYGFTSISPLEIDISTNSYFPEYEGFDLQFDLSASDYIRVFWAYLLGLLEVSRNHETNHLGLLVLDEPRQQSARETNIQAFLQRASQAQEYGQQVIIATSESREVLEQYLGTIPHTYRRFDGRIIAPIR
jgi:hypothetical protein